MPKVIFITGGSSGIGKAIGCYLHDKGHMVYGTSRNPESIKNNTFSLLKLDVTDDSSINAAINIVIEKEGKIDVLINNAGVGITGPLEETPNNEIEKVFATNVYGPMKTIKAILPYMRDQGTGTIINITSIAGYIGLPYRGIYSVTKGAVELLTESLRMEVKDFGIQVTNIAPGDFATNIASGRYHVPIQENSPYKDPYGRVLEQINNDVNEGSNPVMIAKKVYKIINMKNPKIHYKVGAFMQKFSILLKRILPDRLYEQLLRNHYKL
ncbi:SDR family oxidoreductase [Leptobacterium sp. I13]|uniref:SDR family oxidoreductase n=1 Tax=Leptobacterium meishanense TaxID=3128904 RepID=UPI0030EE1EA6